MKPKQPLLSRIGASLHAVGVLFLSILCDPLHARQHWCDFRRWATVDELFMAATICIGTPLLGYSSLRLKLRGAVAQAQAVPLPKVRPSVRLPNGGLFPVKWKNGLVRYYRCKPGPTP